MRMTLAPGEVFEHTHLGDSITTLIEGTVDLIAEGERTHLVPGAATAIAANVSHVLVNVGATPATIQCKHIGIGDGDEGDDDQDDDDHGDAGPDDV